VNLEIPLKSGDAIGFRLALGDDGRSVKVTSEIVKTGGNYRNIIYLEYHTEVEVLDILLKDVLFVKHEDDGDIPLTIIGINEQIPRRASNAPAHFIAMFYEKIRFESEGGKITEMEHKYDFIEAEKKKFNKECVFFDYKGVTKDGDEAIIEVKHGYETGGLEDLKKDADVYLYVAEKEGSVLMYRFYEEPRSMDAMGLFDYLEELSRRHPGRLRIFINGIEWTGG
jgi:hypothetical protein